MLERVGVREVRFARLDIRRNIEIRAAEDSRRIDVFQVLAAGTELCKAYSELVNPITQREAFEDQLKAEAADFPELNFTFVRNDIYDKTNYIYSMFLAREYMNDDLVFLHGDLVFNRKLVHDVLNCEDKNTATVNFTKALPEKDFKGRVKDGKVVEVSIKIFDEDCFAFQPFYKMEKATASAWIGKVVEFIYKGEDKCYAENALNEIFPALNVRAFSYENYYIDEIDNLDDHARVTQDILAYDEADAKIFA